MLKENSAERYSISGEFGQVRHMRQPLNNHERKVPFYCCNGGWHRCNDQYCIRREGGCENGHLFLFSVNDSGRVRIDSGDIIEIPASSVVWLPPRVSHVYYAEKLKIWELYWVHVEESSYFCPKEIFGNEYCLQISFMDAVSKEMERLLCDRRLNDQVFLIESSKMVSNIYHLLLEESCSKNYGSQKKDLLVYDIIRDLEMSCNNDWKLTELSEKYFISVPQLIRRFKAETGTTPYAYLINIRLQMAQSYLEYTGMSVEQISQKTGFNSTSNFIMQFRRVHGITPENYRNQMRI